MTSVGGLRLTGLRAVHDGVTILHGVDLVAPAGEVTVLLGANGAGKTTLIETVSGAVPAAGGTIEIGGRDVSRLGRARRARLGVAHVEQGHRVFPDLSVEENLAVAARGGSHDRAYELFPQLTARRAVAARMLSGGEQQMLVLARALLTRPTTLLIDEMSLGLAPSITRQLLDMLAELTQDGTAILLVEQFAALALAHGERAYVMARGRVTDTASCAELLADPERLHEAYFAEATQGPAVPASSGSPASHA